MEWVLFYDFSFKLYLSVIFMLNLCCYKFLIDMYYVRLNELIHIHIIKNKLFWIKLHLYSYIYLFSWNYSRVKCQINSLINCIIETCSLPVKLLLNKLNKPGCNSPHSSVVPFSHPLLVPAPVVWSSSLIRNTASCVSSLFVADFSLYDSLKCLRKLTLMSEYVVYHLFLLFFAEQVASSFNLGLKELFSSFSETILLIHIFFCSFFEFYF